MMRDGDDGKIRGMKRMCLDTGNLRKNHSRNFLKMFSLFPKIFDLLNNKVLIQDNAYSLIAFQYRCIFTNLHGE